MPSRKRPTAADAATDPNKLARQKAGTYRTGDDRFEVRQAGIGWFLVDSTATNEFGQELVRGPFPTLKEVKEALPEARRTALKALPVPKATKAVPKRPAQPKPAPATWIDKLPAQEATAVRRLVKALELEGIADADELVRSDRKGAKPVVAAGLLERRLEAIVEEVPGAGRDDARRLVQRVTELLAAGGTTNFEPLPGWMLVEIGPDPEPPNRRLVLKGVPKKR